MTTVYKLTDQAMQTHKGYQWALGETRTFSGEGALCTQGWAHAYTHPLLAVLLNPIHANIAPFRLFEGDGVVGLTEHGLKVGCSSLQLRKELSVPTVTTEHRVHFAILCARAVYADPAFVTWAENWLSGIDRSARTAERAGSAAAFAGAAAWAGAAAAWAGAAAWSGEAAARAAGGDGSVEAGEAAALAATAAEAAAWAGTAVGAGVAETFSFIEIAETACADLLPFRAREEHT